jgi:acetolactate synthase-1/2/3 large subunit
VRCHASGGEERGSGNEHRYKNQVSTVVQAMAEVFRGVGTPYVFGLPGGEVIELMNALKEVEIPFLLTKHENTAAFAAGVTGEILGIPGVCIATIGPGATNMATGVANAWMDRDPVIAITGQIASSRYNTATHQVLDSVAFYRPITKWSTGIHPASAAETLHKAIRVATSERPGPVHLSLPSDLAKAETSVKQPTTSPFDTYAGMVAPSEESLSTAKKLIGSAAHPIIFAGIGVVRANAGDGLVRLADKLSAPVIVMPKAKGVIPEDHPLFVGVFEMLGDKLVLEFGAQADLIIACGLDVVEFDKTWNFSAPVVHVDALPNSDEFYPAEVELVGHLATALSALAEQLPARAAWTGQEIRFHRRELLGLITRAGTRMASHQVVSAARKILPKQTVATCDVGAHKFLVGQLWTTYAPKTFFMSNGLSAMGYGLPAAMAAQLAWPDKPVVAFLGDGGFAMYMAELETAVRLKLPLIVVVLCDGALSLVAMAQERRGLPHNAVDFANPDIEKLAKAFGTQGKVCETVSDVETAITSALANRTLTIVQAIVDPDPYRI